MIHIVKNINIIPFAAKRKENKKNLKYKDLPVSVRTLDEEYIKRLYNITDSIVKLYKNDFNVSKLVDFLNYQLLYSDFTSKLLVQSLKIGNVSTLASKIEYYLNENTDENIIDSYRLENHLEIVYKDEELTDASFNVENIDNDTLNKIYGFQNMFENIKGEKTTLPYI